MTEDDTDPWSVRKLIVVWVLITGTIVSGDSLETDLQALLDLKSFLEGKNVVNRGRYAEWGKQSPSSSSLSPSVSPCSWPGITCGLGRVTGINLSDSNISGPLFANFSALTHLSYLDLSANTFSGEIPADLSRCRSLTHLNLSHNIITGELNLGGLNSLEVLDLSVNRIWGEIHRTFPAICGRLTVANLSANNFTGGIRNCFDDCRDLQHLDLSANFFTGEIWTGFARLGAFSVSQNHMRGSISPAMFAGNCTLRILDLSDNNFSGEFPKDVANCRGLEILILWGNKFGGRIPSEIGSISTLEALFLGNNSFSREIPESIVNCSRLEFLDLSKNGFGGKIQETFGKFKQLKFLVIHGNNYTGGILSSGILKLPNISRLDLSFNNFSGPLPVEISQMQSLQYLVLAYNGFNGSIPPEYGKLPRLQALDLSFNKLTGKIPAEIGNLSSLLWLMLANNSLSGEIPPEIGNCSSLLWLNLRNNRLSGAIPPELTTIGRDPWPTFRENQAERGRIIAGSGECLAMKRWIPAEYPPFNFVYSLLTRKNCRSVWNRVLKGTGVFPICSPGSSVRTFQISGYVQLSGNLLSGDIPAKIGEMKSFSLLDLGRNRFRGRLPPEIGQLPLVVLNVSRNNFSGDIPAELGNIKCLQNLDLSHNNFSGVFPPEIGKLTDLNKFNISCNPFIAGTIPATGQLATFEESYFGDPLLHLPPFINSTGFSRQGKISNRKLRKPTRLTGVLVFLTLTLAFLICGILSLVICMLGKSSMGSPRFLLEEAKYQNGFISSSGGSSPWLSGTVKVIRLDKTAFTHSDILKATSNFSEDRILGKGGFGTVYRGMLPDGREVAVKKLQREGIEGEKEFRAEMEVLAANGIGWPHPNLVTLYGWCLNGTEKLLVYEYMGGGSLDDLIGDRVRLSWQRRINVAMDVARALVFLHHECFPAIVHRDVKASNVLLDKGGNARVTDFGLARVVDVGDSHVSTMVAGTVGYVAPEYGQTWQATTKGDVYSFGVLVMELATARRALDGGEECLVEWARRVVGDGRQHSGRVVVPVALLGSGLVEGAEEMCSLLRIGIKCAAENPQFRPNMKEVLAMLINISSANGDFGFSCSPPSFGYKARFQE